MEELIQRALVVGVKAERIALVDSSSIYLDPTDALLNTFTTEVLIIKGAAFTKEIKNTKNKEVDNGTK